MINIQTQEDKSRGNESYGSSVLITGGSGLIGRHLTASLLKNGYKVTHLSRKESRHGLVNAFSWTPEKGVLDPAALDGINYIIHLAGANIGEKRWSNKRKTEILDSRVGTTRLLYDSVSKNGIRLKGFISASAVGYYGSVTSDKIFTEDNPPATDFLGKTCRLWEEGADLFKNDGIRTVKIRTAVVLEKSDSALSKMMMPAKFGFLVQTGNGRQYLPWIHIEDLCNIYIKAIEDQSMNGAYNAVSPQHVIHKEFIKTLAKIMHQPVFPVPVPAFVLKAVLGEMSDVVLKGSRVSADKINNSGYEFLYPELIGALREVLNSGS